ncbi:MAG: flagellar hook protein FlgE [Candidatus Adiutrix sp.]|nr:flagellar hook protein FlgE [Candidatus Adiutrix sp.]
MSFSTLYIASNGMLALGTGMQTISNNLANIETVGYKTMRTNYEDLISQCYFSSGNHNQLGKGSKVESIQSMFTQGAFRTTESDTDIALTGDGFFMVKKYPTTYNAKTPLGSKENPPPATDYAATFGPGDLYYTRAGAFTFDKNGYLVDPSGNVLQGWQMSVPQVGQTPQRLGNPVDIRINDLPAPPVATTGVKLAVNLNADDEASYIYPATVEGGTDEGLGYAGAWDAKKAPPISPDNYNYAESLTTYDSAGGEHTVMVYYQKNPHMENVWDYLVTSDPGQDARVGPDGSPLYNSRESTAGLIQKGKITFSAKDATLGYGGQIKSIEAQNFNPVGNAWSDAAVSGGHFNFDLTVPNTTGGLKPPYPAGTPSLTQTISLNMGASGSPGGAWTPEEFATTQYASDSSVTMKEGDGFPECSLQRTYVRDDGVICGIYDRKREQELFQLSITRFLNPWGLDKMGDNLFQESRFSGQGKVTAPGEGGAGKVLGNFLEQSNVDTATEIVTMIMTQRGFQANSKAITTSDTMLATAIQVKR